MASETIGHDAVQKRFRKLQKKQIRKEMKAAIKLVSAFSDLMQGDHWLHEGGYIDLYCYETLEDAKEMLRPIVMALKPLMMVKISWDWRLFASDGKFSTMADGSSNSDYDCKDLFE